MIVGMSQSRIVSSYSHVLPCALFVLASIAFAAAKEPEQAEVSVFACARTRAGKERASVECRCRPPLFARTHMCVYSYVHADDGQFPIFLYLHVPRHMNMHYNTLVRFQVDKHALNGQAVTTASAEAMDISAGGRHR